MSDERNLTAKEARFCEEYLVDLNGTQAAIRAGYSRRTATSIASENLRKPHIADHIATLKAERSERTRITTDRVVQELGLLGFANMADYTTVQEDGSIVFDFSGLDRDKAAAIGELTVEEFMDGKGENARPVRRTRFKLSDKRGALVALLEHLEGKKLVLSGTVGVADLTEEAASMSPERRAKARAALVAVMKGEV
ncbi:MAG: terminase small subunit [Caulobacter sp.]